MEIIWILALIFAIAYIYKTVTEGNAFKNNSQKLQIGMSKDTVVEIMGNPTYIKNHQDNSYEFIYELSEWKGFWRGGTKVRRMELVFSSEDILISIGKNNNCNMSAW